MMPELIAMQCLLMVVEMGCPKLVHRPAVVYAGPANWVCECGSYAYVNTVDAGDCEWAACVCCVSGEMQPIEGRGD